MRRGALYIAVATVVACGARSELDVPTPHDASIDVAEDHAVDASPADVKVVDSPAFDVVDEVVQLPDAGAPVPAIGSAALACALGTTGQVKCWWKFSLATAVAFKPTIVDIAVGGDHVFARGQDDSLWVMGTGMSCVLGTGVLQQTLTVPTQVTSLGNTVIGVSTRLQYSSALRNDGSVVAWGVAPNGTGKTGTLCAPTPVIGLNAPAIKVAQADGGGCALLVDHTIQCWGINGFGTLGNGSENPADTASDPVTGVNDAVDVALSYSHGCAVRSGGEVVCWGDDTVGQLGDGNINTMSDVPVAVVGLDAPAISVTANLLNSCALLTNGEVECWGGSAATLAPTPRVSSGAIALSEEQEIGCILFGNGSAACWIEPGIGDDAGTTMLVPVAGLP